MDLAIRPRRNRKTANIRNLVAETTLLPGQLILPVFLCEGEGVKTPIKTMPGQFRFSADLLLEEINECLNLGITAFALFPAISEALKDSHGSESLNPAGLLPDTVRLIKSRFPEATVITDVALDPYSSDGHDGVVKDGQIHNDITVPILAKMAVVQAEAGADFVAPSDMMDGRVRAIRTALDEAGYTDVGIIAYTAKYASSFYGPFRDALDSAPKFGDKKTYQMDYRNRLEAIRELQLDIEEGADIVMVKPALAFLDVLREVKNASSVPVAAYNVSGEYAMIKAAAAAGMLDEKKAMIEVLHAFRRAGADMIFTYFAKEFAQEYARQGSI